MVRVPTYNSYINLMNQTLANKAAVDLYSFQATSGLKAPTYSGYGLSAYNIVNLESALGVSQNFVENNKILETEIKAMNTSMESITKSVSQLKSMLNSFGPSDANKITPDQTGGKIQFTNNDETTYVGKTITIDGTKYTFALDNTNPNNIDISSISADSGTTDYSSKLMGLVKDKIDPTGTNPDFKFNDDTFEFPLYTINGSSTVLGAAGVKTGEPYSMSADKAAAMKDLQNTAFATMVALTDSLNISANGKYLFGGGDSTHNPVNFPFRSLQEFQSYYDGVNIKFPSTASANLSNMKFTAEQTGALTFTNTGDNNFTISTANAGGFLNKVATGGATTTGDVTFSSDKNTINATQYGAFQSIKAGDTLVVGRNGNGDDLALTVKSVSADGKTITFEDSTPIPPAADGTVTNGQDLTFSTSYPAGTVINMNGMGNGVAPRVQVVSVNTDGSLNVTADPTYFGANPTTVAASSQWSMSSQSYYQGGDLDTERLISSNQSIMMNVNAGDEAFEKLFRAMGQIAQGNLVDTQDLSQEFDGLVDPNHPKDVLTDAMNLLMSAVNDTGNTRPTTTSSLDAINAKISSDYVMLNNNNTNLKSVVGTLEDSIGSLKNVDKTEAAVKALMASTNLQASYAIMNNILNLSLVNYL